MSDAELGAFLGLTPAEAVIAVPKITPEKRALYERMADVYLELQLWEACLGPKPQGVIVCRDHKHRG